MLVTCTEPSLASPRTVSPFLRVALNSYILPASLLVVVYPSACSVDWLTHLNPSAVIPVANVAFEAYADPVTTVPHVAESLNSDLHSPVRYQQL